MSEASFNPAKLAEAITTFRQHLNPDPGYVASWPYREPTLGAGPGVEVAKLAHKIPSVSDLIGGYSFVSAAVKERIAELLERGDFLHALELMYNTGFLDGVGRAAGLHGAGRVTLGKGGVSIVPGKIPPDVVIYLSHAEAAGIKRARVREALLKGGIQQIGAMTDPVTLPKLKPKDAAYALRDYRHRSKAGRPRSRS